MLTLHCLGDLRLEREDTPLLSGRRKPLALLAFLARRGQRRSTREELAALLWGNSDDAGARKSLRQALSELRAINGVEFSESEAGLAVTLGSIVTDAELFDDDIRSGRWTAALDRWRGDFIAGSESLGDEGWQSWLESERAVLRRQLALACEQLTASAEQRAEWRDVVDAAQRWRSVLPDDGRAWAREIHALQASGRLPDAIARVAEAEHYFRNELRVGVPDEVTRLGRVLNRLGQVAGTAAATLLTPDLVGRSETLAAMARARLASRTREGEGTALLIVAGEGRGKTRVLRDFSRQTSDSDPGTTVFEAAVIPNDKSRPYSLLHTVLTRMASHDALAGCAPETLATLSQITSSVREHFRHIPIIEAQTPNAIAEAFAKVLTEVALESPVVLVLDDFPDGDAESLDVLTPLLHKTSPRTLIIASGRPESWEGSAVLSEVLSHVDSTKRLTLEPLSPSDTRTLLSSMTPVSPAALDSLTESLHTLSGGIPGLLTSLMTHQVTTGVIVRGETGEWSLGASTSLVSIPPDVEDRWRTRYRQLPSDSQRLVDAMAVLGGGVAKTAEVTDLEHVVKLDPNRFREALELLRSAGVLERSDDVVKFIAEVQRQLTYRALPPSTRLQLHARAAKRLRASRWWPNTRDRVYYHRQASSLRESDLWPQLELWPLA